MSTQVERRHRAGLTANVLVTGAVRLLPADERDRYDTEWRAEVYYSPVFWRWGTAVSLVWVHSRWRVS